MKFTKKELEEMITKGSELGLSLEEIIDKNLNLIKGDEVEGLGTVTANGTTNSFVDATTQQVGKNRYFGSISEANSDLRGKHYKLPDELIEVLMTKLGSEGDKRIKGIIDNPSLSYEQIKRFKHDIENSYEGDWSKILGWINNVLTVDRDKLEREKKITHDTGMDNRYRDEHEKEHIKPVKIDKHSIFESVDYGDYKKKALVAILKEKHEQLKALKEEINRINKILNKK